MLWSPSPLAQNNECHALWQSYFTLPCQNWLSKRPFVYVRPLSMLTREVQNSSMKTIWFIRKSSNLNPRHIEHRRSVQREVGNSFNPETYVLVNPGVSLLESNALLLRHAMMCPRWAPLSSSDCRPFLQTKTFKWHKMHVANSLVQLISKAWIHGSLV